MTAAELKKYLRHLDRDTLESILLQMYRNQPASRRELFEITLRCAAEGKPLPARNAQIPSIPHLRKQLAWTENATFGARYTCLKASRRRKVEMTMKEVYEQLIHCPVQAACYEQACQLLFEWFSLMHHLMQYRYYWRIDLYARLKMTEQDLFASIVHKNLESGFTKAKIGGLLSFVLNPLTADQPDILLERIRIFLASLKVNDLRAELMDYMEDWMRRVQTSSTLLESGITDQKLYEFWYGFCLLYMELAAGEAGASFAAAVLRERTDGIWARKAEEAIRDWNHLENLAADQQK